MWKEILKGRLFGHPIHPMLVHFPTALFSAGFIFDIAGIVLRQPLFFAASFYVVLMGLAGGVLAGLFGLIDYVKLTERPEVFQKASWHGGIQFVVIIIFGVILGLKFQSYPEISAPSLVQLIVMGLTLVGMVVGNYLGGELVFLHHVGIQKENSAEN